MQRAVEQGRREEQHGARTSMNSGQVVQAGGVGAVRKKAALAAEATIAPRYMKVRSRPADEPIRAGSAWW